MNQDKHYYGIRLFNDPSDYLAHYGVKGMKWGVRRAMAKGGVAGAKALAKQYTKARKKYDRLNKNANIEVQKEKTSKALKRAAIGAGIASTGLGVGITFKNAAKKFVAKKPTQPFDNLKPIIIKENKLKENYIRESFIRENKIPEKITTWDNASIQTWNGPVNVRAATNSSMHGATKIADNARKASNYNKMSTASKIIGIGGLGYAGYNTGKAIISAYRKSPKGHAKAIAKRNNWRNHMLDTFKNTEYASLPKISKKKHK